MFITDAEFNKQKADRCKILQFGGEKTFRLDFVIKNYNHKLHRA